MEEEKKVVISLKKVPLASEREEIKKRKIRRIVVSLCLVVFLLMGIAIGYFLRASKGTIIINTSNSSSSKIDEVKKIFNQSWLYKNDYDDLSNELTDKALYGMTSFEDDPYTTYMSVDEMNEFTNSINMNYVGIGVQYSYINDIATIIRVFKDSPAEKAGLIAGDLLMKVDGKEIVGLDSDTIKEMVIGEEGTNVTITVNRQGEEKDIVVTRGAVDSTVYVYTKDDVVVMDLMSFGDNTAKECIHYLNDYKDYSKLIIDLRSNGGGYQTAVQEVAGLFLGKDKLVMKQIYNDNSQSDFMTISDEYYDNFKDIVILTNNATASAAEVLTICLKELHPNVTLVGTTTYGKGVVQSTYSLSDGSALKLTSSKWLSPNGVWVNGKGIDPDIEVKLDEATYEVIYNMEDDDSYHYDNVSNHIAFAEKALRYLDYEVDRVDGYFDESFEIALNEYKINHNQEADGILDKKTYESIISSMSYEYLNNESKDYQMLKALEVLGD